MFVREYNGEADKVKSAVHEILNDYSSTEISEIIKMKKIDNIYITKTSAPYASIANKKMLKVRVSRGP